MSNNKAAVQPQSLETPKKAINWEIIKTIVITAFVFGILGLIGGYFATINVRAEARQAVVQDMTLVSKSVEQ